MSSRIGVNLGIEHQQVDVESTSQHVIEAAVANVVGPAVSADDPDALLHHHVGEGQELLCFGQIQCLQSFFELGNFCPLLKDVSFIFLWSSEDRRGELLPDLRR